MRIILALLCSLSLCCGQQIIDSYRFAAAEVLLLDESGMSGATGAYSLRKLRAAHAGSAVQVRRSNDNALADIGFTGSGLNTTALAAHVGSNSGFVATWYDQSGSGRDMVMATTAAQPMIVNAGTLVTGSNGKPALDFDGADAMHPGLAISNFINAGTFTSFVVFNADSSSSGGSISNNDALWAETADYVGLFLQAPNVGVYNWDGASRTVTTAVSTGTWYICQARHESSNIFVKVNAGTEASSAAGNTQVETGILHVGFRANYFNGRMHEFIMYDSALSSGVRTTAVANTNTFYAIY